jgi:hypothetical protein
MAKLTRKKTILVKNETSYGSDASPTGGANAILVRDIEITPLESDTVDRELIRSYLGNFETLLGSQRAMVSFTCELVGSGAAGTSPAYGVALEACAMAVTTVSATSNTYAPISDASSMKSVTIYVNMDGVNHAITGARGTFTINCELNEIPTITFEFTGKHNNPADVTLPTCTYANQADPLLFKNGNTSSFQFYGYAGALQSWELDMANEVIFRELVGGTKSIDIVDRKPSGTLTVEAVAMGGSGHNFFADATGGSTGTNKLTHGTTAGNKIEISCPTSDVGAPSYTDTDGIQMLELPYVAVPNSGNDEVSIKFF